MKKTIIALLALGGMAMADYEEINITTTAPVVDQANNINGFCLPLVNPDGYNLVTSTSAEMPDGVTLTENVTLNFVQLTGRKDGAVYGADAKLAVYVFEGDRTTGTFVGISDNVCSAVTNLNTVQFNFTGVTLASDQKYQFMLVNADSTADNVDTFDGYKDHAVQWGMALTADKVGLGTAGSGNLPGGCGVYTSSGINSWWSHRLIGATINVTNTPEPATATLSLLALAGLCARRRRH